MSKPKPLELVQPASPLAVLVADYLASCRAKGLSPKTIRFSYGYPLEHVLLPWAEENGITSVGQITSRGLDRLSAELMDRKLARASVWTYLKAIKRFLAWAAEEGETVSAKATLPKLEQRAVEILTPKEIERLEDAAGGERDKLIVRVLAESGVRREELTQLTVHDLREEGGRFYLLIHGKGARDRRVPITPSLNRRIRRFVNGRPADTNSDHLFISRRRGRSGGFEPLDPSGVTQLIRDLGEKVGLSHRIGPHTFRHTAATMLLRRGMSPLLVAQILGHSSLAMIQRVYSHLTPTDAHTAMMAALNVREDR